MKNEYWKPIAGYEDIYQVSNMGRVRRLEAKDANGRTCKAQIIKPIVQHSGYCHVGLWRGGKCDQRRVHRLVAQAFIPNPENKQTVNHLNEDKQDNRACNLEWATIQENTVYGSCIEKRTANRRAGAPNRRTPVIGRDKDGNERRFASIADASECMGASRNDGHITACCKGKQKTAYGYTWRYASA